MSLVLDEGLRIGIQTIHRRTEPAAGPWLPTIEELVAFVELVDRCGFDSLWTGDHGSVRISVCEACSVSPTIG
jgi:alkanesulfonate monooxygenase SsuD/methylene tetrahydromethanopterin reductase-like flavin-dependent oxidoreductase (luciferase family)